MAFFLFTDSKFVVVVVGYTLIFLYIELNFNKRILDLSNEFNKLNQKAGGALVESANNMLSIKALGSEKTVAGRVLSKEAMSRDVSISKIHIINFKWILLHVLSAFTLLIFLYFALDVPVWAFTLRADSRLSVNVLRNPLMPTAFTLEAPSSNRYNRHTHLHSLSITCKYIPAKYICQRVLTSTISFT